MFHEVVCPHCGAYVPLGPSPENEATLFSIEVGHTVETLIPGTICGDDHLPNAAAHAEASSGVLLATPEREEPESGFVVAGNTDTLPSLETIRRGPWGSARSEPAEIVSAEAPSPPPDPILDVMSTLELPSLGSGDRAEVADGDATIERPAFPHLDFAPPSEQSPAVSPPGEVAHEEEGEDDAARPSWPLVLLGSYASAVTMALAWLLWTGYGRANPLPETLPAATRLDPSARMAGLTRLGEDRLTTLGKSLTVGSLEFTPLEITAGPVRLERVRPDGRRVASDGGTDALVLRARFKNVSKDETFAPLDPGFIRQPDAGYSDTVIESSGGPIEAYPLAVASERAVVGQSFAEIRPGASVETILVSEGDAKAKLSGAMTWRVKLRVSPDQSAIVGVTFGPEDVR
jgi:hypothetical protein